MNIYVLDKNFKKIGFPIDKYISCIWHTSFFEIGDFELYLDADIKVLSLLRSGKYLVRDQDMHEYEYENVMTIKNIKIDNDEENGDHITVNGKDLKEILDRRVIVDSSVSPNFMGTILSDVFKENFSSPANPARKIPKIDFFCDHYDYKYIYGDDITKNNAGEWMREQCKSIECGIVYTVTVKGTRAGYIDFEVKKVRTPENIMFSSDYGNLLNSSYLYDSEKYKNVAIVVGDEIDGTKITETVNDDISGIDRFEVYVDSSTSKDDIYNSSNVTDKEGTYRNALKSEGEKALKETTAQETFECNVDAHGQFKLDVDFFLGDKVQIVNDYRISATTIITDVIDTHDETGRTIIPRFSTCEVI